MTDTGENSIAVTLLGRNYRVTCTKDEREALLQAVAYLDGKMNDIQRSGKITKSMLAVPGVSDGAVSTVKIEGSG